MPSAELIRFLAQSLNKAEYEVASWAYGTPPPWKLNLADGGKMFKALGDARLDLSAKTPEGKTLLHLIVDEDPELLAAVLNRPDYKREMLDEKDAQGKSPMDILTTSTATLNGDSFTKKHMLELSGFGFKFPRSLTVGQFKTIGQMSKWLELSGREKDFYNDAGLCNGFSYLHNHYVETRGEDYYYSSLLLISLWDGEKESLDAPLPDFLPQSKEYTSLGDMFEQWTNDVFLYYSDSIKKEGVIPDLGQEQRHLQFDMASNDDNDDAVKPVSLYYHGHLRDTYDTAKPVLLGSDASRTEINQHIAEAKRGFKSIDLALKEPDKSEIPMRRIDLDGYETQYTSSDFTSASDDSHIDGIDPHYARFVTTYFYTLGLFENPGYEAASASVLAERMEESLKYLSRLPHGVYVDVGKSGHSTTFRKLENGNIDFYNCNDGAKAEEITNHSTLHTTILQKNGHDDYGAHSNSPFQHYLEELYNTFTPHVYHLNNPKTLKSMESFSLFEEDEFPHSMDDVNAFYRASPGQYTHLHWAVMMRDLTAVKRLLDTGMFLPDVKDACGRTALEVAISNGFIDAALAILDNPQVANTEVSANWFTNAFRMGHKKGFEALLNHPKLSVNIAHVAAGAMQNRCLDLVTYLLREKKINPDSFIQSALLANDLPLIDLLVSFGANVNVKDNKGNTALHHSCWLLNETVCGFVLKHQGNSLTEKNNDGESPLDILLLQARENPANQKKVQNIIRQMVDILDFKTDQKDEQNAFFTLLEFADEINDKDLFQLLLGKMGMTAEEFNQAKLDAAVVHSPAEPIPPSSPELMSAAEPTPPSSPEPMSAAEPTPPSSPEPMSAAELPSSESTNEATSPEVDAFASLTLPSSRKELQDAVTTATKEVNNLHALLNGIHSNYHHRAPVLVLGENLCSVTELLNMPTETPEHEALLVSSAISILEDCLHNFNSDMERITTTPVAKNFFDRFVEWIFSSFGSTTQKNQQKQEQVNIVAQNNPATSLKETLTKIKGSSSPEKPPEESSQNTSARLKEEIASVRKEAEEEPKETQAFNK